MSLSLLMQCPYIICGYNKGFEGRQTTRFRTSSSWCLSEFPLARHGVIRWRPPICLRSFIWFLPYSFRNRICSRFVFSVLEAMFDGWLALNSIRSFEQVDQSWKVDLWWHVQHHPTDGWDVIRSLPWWWWCGYGGRGIYYGGRCPSRPRTRTHISFYFLCKR